MNCRIVNLEDGMPTVEMARIRLNKALQAARMQGDKAVKIIHGYGSSGKGGAIKADVQKILAEKQRIGAIKGYVKGEDFSPFSAASRQLTARCPGLTKDRDYSRGNDGITIVLL